VKVFEVAVSLTVAVGVGGGAAYALNAPQVTGSVQQVSAEATCRAVDQALNGHLALHGAPPATVADLQPLVRGDISRYRLVEGAVVGPGCP
jgi:hypothetical protein